MKKTSQITILFLTVVFISSCSSSNTVTQNQDTDSQEYKDRQKLLEYRRLFRERD